MYRISFICLLISTAIASVASGDLPNSDESENAKAAKTKTVKARTLSLDVPSTWKQLPGSSMRAAQFEIPSADGQPAELIVYYFGGPTGGIQANVERWVGQFAKDDRRIEMRQGDCAAGSFILVDAIGTWNKPDGPPFARKTVKTPDSRVVNVIVVEKKDDARDYYFLKLSGAKDTVSKQVDALRVAIGVKSGTEKPFEMKDADEVVSR